jgi:hypothetical protein
MHEPKTLIIPASKVKWVERVGDRITVYFDGGNHLQLAGDFDVDAALESLAAKVDGVRIESKGEG